MPGGFWKHTTDGLIPSLASVSINASGTNIVLPGITGVQNRIYRVELTAASATTVQFQDGATNLSGAMSLAAGTPLALLMDGYPWFTCSSGNAFNISLGGAVQVAGEIAYTAGVSGPDPSTLAWVSAVNNVGGTVSATRQAQVDTLIKNLKSAGIWTGLDRMWIYAAENAQQAQVDLVNLRSHTLNGAPAFSANRGYTGVDGSNTVFIDTGYNPTTSAVNFTQNAAHISLWTVTNLAAVTGGFGIGQGDGALTVFQSSIVDTFNDGNLYLRINDAPPSGSQGVPGTRTGHWLINRSAAAATQGYQNGASFSNPNATSGAPLNFNFFVLDTNQGGSAGNFGTPNQLAMVSIGGNLSATQVANFFAALRYYMTQVGVP